MHTPHLEKKSESFVLIDDLEVFLFGHQRKQNGDTANEQSAVVQRVKKATNRHNTHHCRCISAPLCRRSPVPGQTNPLESRVSRTLGVMQGVGQV